MRTLAVLLAVRVALALAQLRAWGWLPIEEGAGADRLLLIREWAADPTFLIRGAEFLPYPFWAHGLAVMALPGRVIEISAAVNLAASCAVLALTWVLARDLFDDARVAALAAALVLGQKAYLDSGLLAGVFNAPMLACALGGCVLWLKDLRARDARATLGAAACFGLAGAIRFEGWFFSAVFSGFMLLEARRRDARARAAGALALTWVLPALWIAALGLARGEAFDFIDVHAQTPLYADAWPNVRAYLVEQFYTSGHTVAALWAFAALGAVKAWDGPRERRLFLAFPAGFALLFTVASATVRTNPYVYHTWPTTHLMIPFAAAGLLGLFPPRRRLRGAVLAALAAALPLTYGWSAHPAPLREPDQELARALRRLDLGAERRMLLELRKGGPLEDSKIWSTLALRLFVPRDAVVLDRLQVYLGRAHTWMLDDAANPSLLALPRAELEAALEARGVHLIVAHSGTAMTALGPAWFRVQGPGEYLLFVRGSDLPLINALKTALEQAKL